MASGSNAPNPTVSNVGGTTTFHCPHPGCDRTFTKQANYVSHSRTSILRLRFAIYPSACSNHEHLLTLSRLQMLLAPWFNSMRLNCRNTHGRDAISLRYLWSAVSMAIESKGAHEVSRAPATASVNGKIFLCTACYVKTYSPTSSATTSAAGLRPSCRNRSPDRSLQT